MSDGEHDFFDGMGGIQSMGILNALRTGDPRIDMILAMCFPFLVKYLLDGFRQVWTFIQDMMNWKPNLRLHERRIVHKMTRDRWGGCLSNSSENEDTQNTILIKAIDMFLHSQMKLDLTRANIDLTSTEDKNASVGQRHNHYYYYHDSDDEDDQSKTLVGALSKYRIVKKPPLNEWHNLGKHGTMTQSNDMDKNYNGGEDDEVLLRIERQELDSSGNNQTGNGGSAGSQQVISYIFSSDSGIAIDTFIDKAYNWYLDELRKLDDNSRYLYELKSNSFSRKDDEDDGPSGRVYTRYRLSDEKTFDSLFFREKESLLHLIQHFTNKSGKYNIPGYPHKLGLLLSGCPGSGKTSFIKALAQHTGRSIVNVPLARVSTNAELMSIFFNHRKYVEGENMPAKLGFQGCYFCHGGCRCGIKCRETSRRETQW